MALSTRFQQLARSCGLASAGLRASLLPSLCEAGADGGARGALRARPYSAAGDGNRKNNDSGFQDWWCLDMTFGRKAEAYQDCRLAEEVKDEMYRKHKKEGWEVARLAEHYQIRQQRVMGILTLRELREEDVANGVELDYGFENYANQETDTRYQKGSGEMHIKSMPSEPRYVTISEGEESNYVDLETRLAIDSAAEEERLVEEFKEKLAFNMWKTGGDLERHVSRHKTAAKRPDDGWTYVIKPLDANGPEPFAAKTDGTKRKLTDSEKTFQDRQKGRPRRKIPT